MAAYTAQGVDCMLDLEHLALGDLSRPDASDARGWFKLAVRSGELWAVDIKFTTDGARRLAEKTQRYTSPAFLADEHGRISELINVALVAMPATHQAAPLVAAARKTRVHLAASASAEDVRRALDAALKDAYPNPSEAPQLTPWVSDVYADYVVFEFDGKLLSAPYTYAAGTASIGNPVPVMRQYVPVTAARGCAPPKVKHTVGRSPQALSRNPMNPELLKKILAAIEAGEDKSGLLAEIVAQAAGGAAEPASDVAAGDALSDTAASPPADPNKPAEMAALTARLAKLEAERTASVQTLSARIAELESERSAEDQAERVKLCGQLVVLGAETPATAWEGEPEELKPSKRLQAIALSDLRDHVKALSARGPIVNAEPATKSGPAEIKLSKTEREYCAKHNLTPEQFQDRKASTVKLHKATK